MTGIYVGSLDAKPKDQSRQRILATRSPVSYVNGYLFFMRDRTLMAQAFEAERLQLSGEPVPLAEGVDTTWFDLGVFSVSPGGVLAYRILISSGTRQFTWFDRQGKILSTFGQPGTDVSIHLSPDGTRGVVNEAASNGVRDFWSAGDLWTLDVSSGQRTRFTFRQSGVSPGVWSPDGKRIAFAAGNGLDTIYDKLSSGVGDERELLKEPGIGHYPTSWSSDGRFLLYNTTNTPKTRDDIWILPVKEGAPGERKPVLLLGKTSTSGEHASRPTCTGLPTSPTRHGIERSLCGRSWLRGHPACPRWARANGRSPKTAETFQGGARMARRLSTTINHPQTSRQSWK